MAALLVNAAPRGKTNPFALSLSKRLASNLRLFQLYAADDFTHPRPRMPIVCFENREVEPLILVIAPQDDRHEVPHLATIGIRYELSEGAQDRSYSVVNDGEIEFWCNAESVDVEVVHPGPFDRLLWDICVKLGFCGSVIDGKPSHVCDLIPETGTVTAGQFADLVMQAEGCAKDSWRESLAASFVEHFGETVVPTEQLQMNLRRPFDPA